MLALVGISNGGGGVVRWFMVAAVAVAVLALSGADVAARKPNVKLAVDAVRAEVEKQMAAQGWDDVQVVVRCPAHGKVSPTAKKIRCMVEVIPEDPKIGEFGLVGSSLFAVQVTIKGVKKDGTCRCVVRSP